MSTPKEWQDNLERIQRISGTLGKDHAKAPPVASESTTEPRLPTVEDFTELGEAFQALMDELPRSGRVALLATLFQSFWEVGAEKELDAEAGE